MIKEADCRNYMSTRQTTASRCRACVRPHLSAVKTRRLNAPLCLNLSCWLYGNDASQAKHNKPLASSACRQQHWERRWSHSGVCPRARSLAVYPGNADWFTNMSRNQTWIHHNGVNRHTPFFCRKFLQSQKFSLVWFLPWQNCGADFGGRKEVVFW